MIALITATAIEYDLCDPSKTAKLIFTPIAFDSIGVGEITLSFAVGTVESENPYVWESFRQEEMTYSADDLDSSQLNPFDSSTVEDFKEYLLKKFITDMGSWNIDPATLTRISV